MKNKTKKQAVLLAAILSLIFLFSACAGASSQNNGQAQVVYPTVYITQFVTQVVTTVQAPAASSNQPAADTPEPVAAVQSSVSFDPFAVPIYYPLLGCSASRLHVGDQATIQYSQKAIGLYHYKSLEFEPALRYLPVGMEVNVTDGPYCDESTIFWKVESLDKTVYGFYPEGNGDSYWMLPYSVTSTTPDLQGGVHPSGYLKLHVPYKCHGR